MPKSHCSTTSGPGRLPCGSPFPHNHRQYHKASHRRQPCHCGKTPGYLQYPAGYCAHSHHTAGPPPASESSGQPAAANTAPVPAKPYLPSNNHLLLTILYLLYQIVRTYFVIVILILFFNGHNLLKNSRDTKVQIFFLF